MRRDIGEGGPSEVSPEGKGEDVVADTQESLEKLASDSNFAGEVLVNAADSVVERSRRKETTPDRKALKAVVAAALIFGASLGCERPAEGVVGEDEEVAVEAVEDERGKELERKFEEGEINDEDLITLVLVREAELFEASGDLDKEESPENLKRFIEATARYKKAFKEAQERGLFSGNSPG